MRYLPNPKNLQFELSNVCNLHCLGCIRTDNTLSAVKTAIGNPTYLSLDTFYKIISSKELDSVECLHFCGRIDDPLAHPFLLQILQCAINFKPFKIIIHTNGSLRNSEYWKKLGNLFKDTKHTVLFNIDGLEDTNHIYRQGSVWSNIIDNAKSYISTGAEATWQFIEFPWNKHQILEAFEFSKQLGFTGFNVRKDRSRIQNESLEKIILIKKTAEVKEINDPNFLSNKFLYNTEPNISCMNEIENMYFIEYTGRLWPCCFIPNGFIEDSNNIAEVVHLQDRIYNNYSDTTWNDCNIHPISSIINHKFYTEDLVDSWESKNHGTGNKDRIFRCTMTCSQTALKIKPAHRDTTTHLK